MNKKIIFPVVVLVILLVPIVSVSATENANVNNVTGLYIGARNGKIIMSIVNDCNESSNYSFIVVYGIFRNLILKNRSPTIISENGTVNANSTLEKTYRVKLSFSPIVAFLQIDNKSLICAGFVFGKRVIFRTTAVIEGT